MNGFAMKSYDLTLINRSHPIARALCETFMIASSWIIENGD